jgi:tetratricopeptide (TPR) repeat protein
MGQLAEKAQNDSLRHPYLERAAEEARTLGDWERNPDLRFDYAHYVLGDHELAARERRAIVEQRPSPYTINIYAGYCFEHRVDLDAAEELAREGIEMEGSPQTIAMLTDTLAELVNLHGETEEALGLIERCIELDPDNEHFRNQERRFREVLAQGAESP